jgi:hypothetical protein
MSRVRKTNASAAAHGQLCLANGVEPRTAPGTHPDPLTCTAARADAALAMQIPTSFGRPTEPHSD